MRRVLIGCVGALALAGCGESGPDAAAVDGGAADGADTALADVPAPGSGDVGTPESGDPDTVPDEATAMADRVATIGLLNKRNNVARDFELSPGDVVEEGPVIIRLDACERTAPYEFPQETGAFVQVDIRERGESDHTRVFSGWLFKENPSLNVVEHPIYDVWVKDCAMSFPGDE